jgi:small-conductance mechanosensitive channel
VSPVSVFVRLVAALVLLAALGARPALAQAALVKEPAAAAAGPASATLALGSRAVFVFRAPLSGYTPQDRADAAERRLERALARSGPHQPTIRSIPEGTQVLLDGALLFVVTPGDVNTLAGDTTELLAQESAAELAKALRDRREQRSPRYLAQSLAVCLLATGALVLALRLLGAVRRRIRRRLEVVLARRLEQIRLRNVRVLDVEHLIRFAGRASDLLAWALGLLAAYVWLAFVLSRIPLARTWGERLQGFLLDTVAAVAGSMAHAIPGLLVVALIVALARLATLTLASVARRVESGELHLGWLDRDTAVPTRRLASVLIWLFALAMAYPYLPGSHTAAFQGVTVLAGLMVSIGASSIVGQGAAGLILMYTRSLRKGDYVCIGDVQGTVVEPGVFETRVRTGLGVDVAMPNSWILSNTIRNYSRAVPGAYVFDTTVTIGYDTPWRQVHAMLEEAARATEGVAADPRPYVVQAALSDFYIEYKLVGCSVLSTARNRAELLTHLHQNIVDVFNLHGVQIMSPHFVQEPLHPHVVPPEQWAPEAARPEGA